MMRTTVSLIIAVASTSYAHAEPKQHWRLDLGAGTSFGVQDVTAVRVGVGYLQHLPLSRQWSIYGSPGIAASFGVFAYDNPSGIDGVADAKRQTYEVGGRIGIAWTRPDQNYQDLQLYGSMHAVFARNHAPPALVADAGSQHGFRLAVGINFPGAHKVLIEGMRESKNPAIGLAVLILPNTFEWAYESIHVDSSRISRHGFLIGWSI